MSLSIKVGLAGVCVAAMLLSQQPPRNPPEPLVPSPLPAPPFGQTAQPAGQPAPRPVPAAPVTPAGQVAAQPAPAAPATPAGQTTTQQAQPGPAGGPATVQGLNLHNASLNEVI